jgi:hypothetical protein
MEYKFSPIDELPSKYIAQLKEFLDSEVGNYSDLYENLVITHEDTDDDFEYFTVKIQHQSHVNFKIDADNIYVQLGGNWYETNTYDWQVKYFWMALLWN